MSGQVQWPSLIPWERRLIALEAQPLQADGWGPETRLGSPAGDPLHELRHTPVVVLRAERGAGKTEAFKQEHTALRTAGLHVERVDLGRCQSETLAVQELERAFVPPGDGSLWYVLLDSLDEGLNMVPALDQHITTRLGTLDAAALRTLRLRISCRTGWPQHLHEDLARIWSSNDIDTRGLAALTRSDAESAARSSGVADPEAFIQLVQDRALVALAAHPVTLRQMVTAYGAKGQLPRTAYDAYRDACEHLCTESRRPNDRDALDRVVPAGDLMAVAARIAAAAQFGRHGAICDHPQPRPGDLDVALLHGGEEPGPLGAGVDCTLRELRQVLESGLFVPIGEQRWKFAHHSYQEFLAAQFLDKRRVHPEVQRELLWAGDGPARHVLAAHQQVAAWRCTHDSALFEDLLRDDPLVLQSADLPALPEARRQQATAAFLSHFEKDDTADFQWEALAKFAHPRLAEQLRPYLRTEAEENLLYTAVALADACRPSGIDDELLALADNRDLPEAIRVRAVSALHTPAPNVVRLQNLTAGESPEVAAAALDRLWPEHIGLERLLDLMPEPVYGYFGTAWMFRRKLVAGLGQQHQTAAVSWAHHALKEPGRTDRWPLAVSLISQALPYTEPGHPDSTGLTGQITEAVLTLSSLADTYLHSRQGRDSLTELGAQLSCHPPVRRMIARAFFKKATVHQLLSLDSSQGTLLPYDDALYWMKQWATLTPPEQKMARYAVSVAKFEDPAALQAAQEARAAHPSLREATSHWDNPRQAAAVPTTQPPPPEALHSETALRAALSGVHAAAADRLRMAWWDVLKELYKTADGTSAHRPTSLSFATEAPSYPPPGSALLSALQDAARHLLESVTPLTAAELATHKRTILQTAPEVAAFAVIGADAAKGQLGSAEQAAGWTVALSASTPHSTDDTHLCDQILPTLAARAGHAVTALAEQVVPAAPDPVVQSVILNLPAHAPQTRPAIHAWATDPQRSPKQWQIALRQLALHGDTHARDLLRAALAHNPTAQPAGSPARTRWIYAAHALMHRDTAGQTVLPEAWPHIRRHLDDPGTFNQLFDELSPPATRDWPDATGALSEEDLADLYCLIVKHLGPQVRVSPYQHLGAITREHRRYDLVRALPALIAHHQTPTAAAELHRLADLHAPAWDLRHAARSTERAAAARTTTPLVPRELLGLADNRHLRRVTDERQLHDVVLESLHRFQKELSSPNGLVLALWNRDQHGTDHTRWWPCWEEDFSDLLATFLRLDIEGHRVIINREVQLRRPGLPGLRTDILIEAPGTPGSGEPLIRVVVECKGCWNKSLPTALAGQLVSDYLSTPKTAGIFLVGYFDSPRWGIKKRQCPARKHTLSEITAFQDEQARQQRDRTGKVVSAIVIDCRLPGSIDP
ncbi:hypothetical protein [Streptomyces sp. NPDC096351]|uniref:hypothetical protein n=1 Tax=Streptomyces sp. NPDC096351 TaxID=3366087 RepID=UPI0037FEEED0